MSFNLQMNLCKTLAVCIAVLAAPSPAGAREFRVADTQSEDYPTVQALTFMARIVEERSGGRHRIRVFHSRQLGEEKETIEQTRVGAIDLNRTNVAPIGSLIPAANVLALPFLFRSFDHLHKVLDQAIGEEILASSQRHGFVGLTFYDSGIAVDLQQRAAGAHACRHERLANSGAAIGADVRHDQGARRRTGRATVRAGATGLSTRLIDGAENNWPSYVTTNHYKLAPYYTLTEHTMGPELLVMSPRAWESLSAEDQDIFRDAARKSSAYMRELWNGLEERSRQQARAAGDHHHQRFRPKAVRAGDEHDLRKERHRSGPERIDRAYSQDSMSLDLLALKEEQSAAPTARQRRSLDLETQSVVRVLPIRWRLLSIAALNATVAIILAALIWNGANVLSRAWDDVRTVRESDKLLVLLESEASRLQNLIHRYINQPSQEVLTEILGLHGEVLSTLRNRGAVDPVLSGSADELRAVTERFLQGFGEVRELQTTIAHTYENDVLKPAREMAGLYAIIEGAIGTRDALLLPSLGKSREAFTASLVAANAFYLSLASDAADEARRNITTVEQTIPVMIDLAENDLQRAALTALAQRAAAFGDGLKTLAEQFATRTNLLKTAIDDNQAAMIEVINKLSAQMTLRELQAQGSFDHTLANIYQNVALVAVVFLTLIVVIGVLIARSIILPLKEIMAAMHAVVSEKYDQPIQGTQARDEIGEMARAVAVFRENAIAKRKAENELRASKDRAEKALEDLREAQQNLIAAEKLAALGGLVAGVAHEVNNPIGISLTVASSFARRCDDFANEVGSGPLRRSRLDEFLEGGRDAANQLVANLQRAGELVQSFKQVAVDRSHADRRQFDLRESTDQIVASLRPVLKKSQITLTVDVPAGIIMDSYPGSYGQVLTNLFLNSVVHAFPDGRAGSVMVEARQVRDDVEIFVSDDGVGMSEDIQRRAFDPFFTTRRGEGGTGLGLHIIFNLVTQQLGGRLAFESRLGWGTRFRITLPRVAPGESPPEEAAQ